MPSIIEIKAVTVSAMLRNRSRIILILAGLGVILCCASTSVMQIMICQTPVPDEFPLSPRISAFVGTDDYGIGDLVTTSQETVQEQLNFLDEAESEFVSASYNCRDGDCTLFDVQIRVMVQRKIGCLFSTDDSFAHTVTNLSFDVASDELSATTYLRDDRRRNLLPWEELPLSIDEIIQIALAAEGSEYANEFPEFELRVSLLRDRWELAFRSGATPVPDIQLQIDFNGNPLAG